jgi:hypothetical protein
MEPRHLKKPKNHTPAELQSFHDELKRYEASLRRWDMRLQEREDALEMAEQALLDGGGFEGGCVGGFDEGCDCGFEEMSEGCDCDWCEELRESVTMGGKMAQSYARFLAVNDKPASGDELSFLGKLYKLNDGRKEK